MESSKKAIKRKRGQSGDPENEEMQIDEQPVEKRKIIKVKKTIQPTDKIIDDGEEIELGSEEEFEDEDIIDSDEDVGDAVADDNDGEWEDVGSDEEKKDGIKFWDGKNEPLKEGEELVYDSSAYIMLHRAKVEWPCLSIDVLLRDRIGAPGSDYFPHNINALPAKSSRKNKQGEMRHREDRFPNKVYMVAGSQSSQKSENRIYVMKWSEMHKTLHEDDAIDHSSEESEHEFDKEPVIRFESVPHKGSVNRIRSMYGTGIVATWNDENDVGIYNISEAIDVLDTNLPAG